MSYVSTEIDSYQIAVFAQTGTPAKINLYSGRSVFAVAFLRPEGEALPKAHADAQEGYVRLYYHRQALPDLVDLLRNEKPVYLHFWDGPGDNTHLASGREPVGEGE
jgi:hypothetical protein